MTDQFISFFKNIEVLQNNLRTQLFDYLIKEYRHLIQIENSFWHPLGFFNINVYNFNEDQSIRIHFWPQNTQNQQKKSLLIHDHKYDFESFILKGKLTNIIYKTGDNHKKEGILYLVSYDSQKSILTKEQESIFFEEISRQIYQAGQKYKLDAKVFHSTEIDTNSDALTCLFIQKQYAIDPRVIGIKESRSEHHFSRMNSTEKENKILFEHILSILK